MALTPMHVPVGTPVQTRQRVRALFIVLHHRLGAACVLKKIVMNRNIHRNVCAMCHLRRLCLVQAPPTGLRTMTSTTQVWSTAALLHQLVPDVGA